MWNVKCANKFKHVQNNVTTASNYWICKHFLIVSNLDIIRFNLRTPEIFFSLLWSSFVWNLFYLKIFVSLFVVVVYYTFLQEQFRSNVATQKLCGTVIVLEIHRKLTCYSSLREFIGLRQGALLQTFKDNNLAKVSFLKLLKKENLLLYCR